MWFDEERGGYGMVQEERRQGEGEHPNPQGQNIPGQPMQEQGRPEVGRDASPPPEPEPGREPDLPDDRAEQA